MIRPGHITQQIFLLLFLKLSIYSCDVDIRRWSDGEGFHRKLSYVIQVNGRNCSTHIKQLLPSGAYFDIYELNRLGINASIQGAVDIEAPEFLSNHHTLYIYQKTSDFGNLLLEIPIHLRYHSSTPKGQNVEIYLPESNVVVNCSQTRSWKRIVKSEVFHIPTGNLNDSNNVLTGTCFCSIISLFIVLYGIFSFND